MPAGYYHSDFDWTSWTVGINNMPNVWIVPTIIRTCLRHIFTISALLEPELLKLSIPHLTPTDFSQAESILRKFETELRSEGHVATWGRLNWQFHSIVYSRSERPRFLSIIRNVNNSGERYTRLQLYLTDGAPRANEEHRQLLELCRRCNSTAACKLLRQHIHHAGLSLKEASLERRKTTV